MESKKPKSARATEATPFNVFPSSRARPQISIGKNDPARNPTHAHPEPTGDGRLRESPDISAQSMASRPEELLKFLDAGLFDIYGMESKELNILLKILENYVRLNEKVGSKEKLVQEARTYIEDIELKLNPPAPVAEDE